VPNRPQPFLIIFSRKKAIWGLLGTVEDGWGRLGTGDGGWTVGVRDWDGNGDGRDTVRIGSFKRVAQEVLTSITNRR
jgi:hypothetical protein